MAFINTNISARTPRAGQAPLETLAATLKAGKAPRIASFSGRNTAEGVEEKDAARALRAVLEAYGIDWPGHHSFHVVTKVTKEQWVKALKSAKPQAAEWKGAVEPSPEYLKALNAILRNTESPAYCAGDKVIPAVTKVAALRQEASALLLRLPEETLALVVKLLQCLVGQGRPRLHHQK